jgi:hypothetical protein
MLENGKKDNDRNQNLRIFLPLSISYLNHPYHFYNTATNHSCTRGQSQHAGTGHAYTSDWLQYCRNGMGGSSTKSRGGGIYADSDSYHYPSSHSPTSTAQLHQASLINSNYATQGVKHRNAYTSNGPYTCITHAKLLCTIS